MSGPETPESGDGAEVDAATGAEVDTEGEATETDAAGSGTGTSRRLHPLTVPYRVLQQGTSIAILLFVVVPGLSSTVGGGGGLATLGLVVAGVGLFVGYFVAYYRRFEYELTADTFDIRSGVLSRREREIPLRRIQNVDISQNVVQRALGIAQVGLETAGGGQTEAQLQYVDEDEADHLQSEISRLSRSNGASGDGEAEPDSERFETVFSITPREIGVLGVVSMDFRVASFLFFGASVFAPSAVSAVDDQLFFGPEGIVGAVLGPLAGLAVVALLALLSGFLNAARYYGFTLDRGGEELRYERGLLQRYRGTIPLSKVQSLTIEENVLARALGYASLTIETAGHTPGNDQSGGSQSAIPLAERDRVTSLARSIESYGIERFQRPPKRARQRYAARYAIALVSLAAVLSLGTRISDYRLYWYAPLAGLLLVPIAAHLKWKHRGYALGDDHVVTRNGFWVRKFKIVPYHRVQTVFSSETIFQRRRDLGTVTIDTAGSQSLVGSDAQAVDIDSEAVEAIRERVPDELYASLARRRRDGRERNRFSAAEE
jgi:putative membrane protein